MRSLYWTIITFFLVCCGDKNEIVSLVKVNNKFGFIDRSGNWYIKPVSDSLGTFYNGYAGSYRDRKGGLIDKNGQQIIAHDFDFIGNVEEGFALIIVNDSINYVDLDGHLISAVFLYEGNDFSCGLAPVQFVKYGKWGYMDQGGKLRLDTIYDYASEFKDCVADVRIGDIEFKISKNGTILDTIDYAPTKRRFKVVGNSDSNSLGMINSAGDTIMDTKYKTFGYLQGNAFWFNDGSVYGIADTTGRILSSVKYEYLTYFSDNGLAIAKKNGKYGFIDKDLVQNIDFKFQDAQGFKHGLAAVKVDGKWGFINETGEMIIQPKFDNVLHQFRPINARFESMYTFERE